MEFSKWVKGRLAENDLRQIDLAEKLHLTQQSLSAKLKTGRFTLLEVITIFRYFKADDQTILRIMR